MIEKFEFGSYPQKRVEDAVLAFKLTDMTGKRPKPSKSYSWTSYKYFLNGTDTKDYMWYTDVEKDGEKYRGVYFVCNRPSSLNGKEGDNSEQLRCGFKPNTVYWFKYEPLKWEILEKNDRWAYLVSEKIIDSQDYSHAVSATGETKDSNLWAESSLREWLNSSFFETAFSEDEKKKILLSEHSYRENSEEVNSFATDRIFLLSLKDVLRRRYGFVWKEEVCDRSRQKFATDYSECQGIHPDPASAEYYSDKYQGQRDWWILDPVNKDGNRFVDKFGGTRFSYAVGNTAVGVVPCMKISTGEYNGIAEDPDMVISEYIKAARECSAEGKLKEAYEYMLRAAESGDEFSMYDVASRLLKGTGVSENKEEAVKWYKRVAEEGTDFACDAMYEIGMIYYNKDAASPDALPAERQKSLEEAFRWISLSAKWGGSPDSLYQLAFMLENGIGAEKDTERAKEMYELAAYNESVNANDEP